MHGHECSKIGLKLRTYYNMIIKFDKRSMTYLRCNPNKVTNICYLISTGEAMFSQFIMIKILDKDLYISGVKMF